MTERGTGPDLSLEDACGHDPVCGIDEAGRGPWAGPVVASAVILPISGFPEGLDDSKKLTAQRRDDLAVQLRATSLVGVGIADPQEIDELNIRQATFLAMRRAVADLTAIPRFALIDGRDAPDVGCPAQAVIKGDGRSLSIAAASIIAKTVRDAMMVAADVDYPDYGFARHKGYGTALHQTALDKLGITPLHRKSFAPVKARMALDVEST
ncbi:MAG: ribonuclease HII [Candidatus Phaeomarinobacter sp.]